MELAAAVLAWTGAVNVAITTLMLAGYLAAKTDLVRAQIASEKRLH